MDPTIYVVNRSTLVKDADAQAMCGAISTQITRDVAPSWGMVPVPVQFHVGTQLPDRARVITVLDTIDDAQALGYHTEDPKDHITGVVGCKVVLDQGAKALTGPYAVSTVLSHEVLEMFVDPFCSSWSDTGQGVLVATEVCDPVQSDLYYIGGIAVSNFVTAAWFDPAGQGEPFDHLGNIRAPFHLTKGGYVVRVKEGRTSQVFGEAVPDWVQDLKRHEATRAARRTWGRR